MLPKKSSEKMLKHSSPIRLLTVISFISTLSIVASVIFNLYFYNSINTNLKQAFRFTVGSAKLNHFEETLKMSNTLFAVTGKKEWLDRYEVMLAEFNKSLLLYTSSVESILEQKTNLDKAKNEELFKLDQDIQEFTQKGDQSDALNIVYSSRYITGHYIKEGSTALFFTSSQRYDRLLELTGLIRKYDERLTMSAYLAALTGNIIWTNLYKEAEGKLDSTIVEATSLAESERMNQALQAIDSANQALVDLEHRTLRLVEEGKQKDAEKIIINPTYDSWKEAYLKGLNMLTDELKRVATIDFEKELNHAWIAAVGSVAALITILLLWFYSMYVVRKFFRELVLSNSKLEQNEIELESARDLAEAGSRSKSAFLANMSHEIRTPLNGIVGMIALLSKSELSNKQRDYVDLAKLSVESLTGVINDILDFSKIEAGKMELFEEFFDIRKLVEDVVQQLAHRAEEKGLIIASFVQQEVPECIKGDKLRLKQVLTNLVGNAIKFTLKGRIIVKLAYSEMTTECCKLHFYVQDTGVGISEEAKTRLFSPFTQADISTTKQFGGTGLGLAISKQLIERMGGEMGVDSTLGAGSNFWFTLSTTRQPIDTETNRYFQLKTDRFRILLVDTDEQRQAIIADQFKSWGLLLQVLTDLQQLPEKIEQAQKQNTPFHIVMIQNNILDSSSNEIIAKSRSIADRQKKTVFVGLACIAEELNSWGLTDLDIHKQLNLPIRQSNLLDEILQILANSYYEKDFKNHQVLREEDQDKSTEQISGSILVAEDNEINQIVIAELIKQEGYNYKIVANGREAVQAVTSSQKNFDLILMDCHMPIIDGFSATQQIRIYEETNNSRAVPIIALTADVIAGVRDKCLNAGMNDYITKPVDADQLHKVLKKFIVN